MPPRSITTFSTTIPDDAEWSEESEVVIPGGKMIACVVRDYLESSGVACRAPALRDSYGWEFTAKSDGLSFLIVVQIIDEWILQCEPIGKSQTASTSVMLNAISKCLANDHRFNNIRWHHSADFERGELSEGSKEPY